MRRLALALALLMTLVMEAAPSWGQGELPKQISDVKIDQRLGEQVPLKLVFRDSSGKPVRLEKFFQDKPVILVLAYYRCPRLCSVVINNVLERLTSLPLAAGKDFHLVVVSFDPEETYELAAKNKELALQKYGRGEDAGSGLHFLTGEEKEIKPLADAVGFRYVYDPVKRIYEHGAGIMVLTPEGKVARYLFGIDFAPQDLRLALVEASENRIGSPVDQVLLWTCLAYDPTAGKYNLAVMKLMRLAAIVTMLILGLYLWRAWSKERRRAKVDRMLVPANVPESLTANQSAITAKMEEP